MLCMSEVALEKSSQSSDVFSSSGFRDWSKALVKNCGFDKHTMSKEHSAAETTRHYMTVKSVVCQLSEENSRQATQKQMQIVKNWNILGRLFDIMRLAGKLGMPFRGHREDAESHNKGLYRKLVEFTAAAGDEVLKDHLENMSTNATYISPTIQNQMTELVGGSLLEAVVVKVKEAGMFSVLMQWMRLLMLLTSSSCLIWCVLLTGNVRLILHELIIQSDCLPCITYC